MLGSLEVTCITFRRWTFRNLHYYVEYIYFFNAWHVHVNVLSSTRIPTCWDMILNSPTPCGLKNTSQYHAMSRICELHFTAVLQEFWGLHCHILLGHSFNKGKYYLGDSFKLTGLAFPLHPWEVYDASNHSTTIIWHCCNACDGWSIYQFQMWE